MRSQECGEDESDPGNFWLDVEKDSISVQAESSVTIHNNDSSSSRKGKICYDFGKESPAPAEYLAAIVIIDQKNLMKSNLQNPKSPLDY
jgi:hypothetical protein